VTAGSRVDLSDAEVVDDHCHGFRVDDLLAQDPAGFETRLTIMGMCFVSARQSRQELWERVESLTDSTVFSLTARRWLAERLGCEPTAEAVAEVRDRAIRADPTGYIHGLLKEGRHVGLVTDEGFPLPKIPREEFEAATGVPVHRVVRIEPLIADRLGQPFDELEEGLDADLDQAADDPRTIAFKSIIAYRTGLDVQQVSRDEAAAGYERWLADGFAESREHSKPVRDYLLARTLAAAKRHDRAMHIHCGDGDPDVVFDRARPQDLYPTLVRHMDQPIVLIHAGHPWSHEAGYIASLLPNVYVDLSVLVPWASSAMDGLLATLVGMVPAAKLLYSSDEASEPEVFWLSARMFRSALERVLSDAVDRDYLTAAQGEEIGRGILAGNTRRLHGLLG
jgi:predicted TIM-barrel fold metal-dependent hydrolase